MPGDARPPFPLCSDVVRSLLEFSGFVTLAANSKGEVAVRYLDDADTHMQIARDAGDFQNSRAFESLKIAFKRVESRTKEGDEPTQEELASLDEATVNALTAAVAKHCLVQPADIASRVEG